MLLADGGSACDELGSALGGVTAMESSSVDPIVGTRTGHWPQSLRLITCVSGSPPRNVGRYWATMAGYRLPGGPFSRATDGGIHTRAGKDRRPECGDLPGSSIVYTCYACSFYCGNLSPIADCHMRRLSVVRHLNHTPRDDLTGHRRRAAPSSRCHSDKRKMRRLQISFYFTAIVKSGGKTPEPSANT